MLNDTTLSPRWFGSYLSCSIFISLSCSSSISGIVREWYWITGPLYTVLPVSFYIYLIILHLLYQWHSERVVPDHWSPVHCLTCLVLYLSHYPAPPLEWHSERVVPDHWSPVHCLTCLVLYLSHYPAPPLEWHRERVVPDHWSPVHCLTCLVLYLSHYPAPPLSVA